MTLRNSKYRIVAVAIGLMLFAFCVRAVGISYPAQTVFDEGVSVMMASEIVKHQGIFDIHPPLTHLLDAAFLAPHELPQENLGHFGADYGDFPYERLRMIRVVLGTLLVGVIFGIAYMLYKRLSLAIIPAFLVAIDPALIVYSRLILPDMVLLFFGFTGILLFLFSRSAQQKKYSLFIILLIIFAAVCFGLALSVKWTALGFLLIPAYYLVRDRKWSFAVLGISMVAVTYITVFHIFFANITSSTLLPITTEDKIVVDSRPLPQSRTIFSTAAYLPTYTKNMKNSNSQFQENNAASMPFGWPLGEGSIQMLRTGENKGIMLVANNFSWSMALAVLVILLCGFFVWRKLHDHLYAVTGVLIASLFLNYLPFFVIGRTFYLYHYFTALIFGFLLIPAGIVLFKHYLPHGNSKKYSPVVLAFLFIALIFSLAVLHRTYGV
ncbi:MAG: dolichyl-phosphate-mannose-protein mannosyltransferase [Candidatus Paceibacter sp.]|jgi:dolichyl-phosphate-mannose--protein O-mannosyl transferase|nr:dolichyl-phosphate-mannose-protein mannosyltransferase [Candidatus Paceibacter sp.]